MYMHDPTQPVFPVFLLIKCPDFFFPFVTLGLFPLFWVNLADYSSVGSRDFVFNTWK